MYRGIVRVIMSTPHHHLCERGRDGFWLCDRIRGYRIQRDLTRRELAKMIGVSHVTVWRWEHASIETIRDLYLDRLCIALEVSWVNLVEGSDASASVCWALMKLDDRLERDYLSS